MLDYPLPGYEEFKAIQIDYYIPSGTQGPEHPNPGHPYQGTSRTAYLPSSYGGLIVFKVMQAL
jgi:deltex-like protein